MKKVLVCLLIGLAMLTTSCKKNDENSNQNNSKSETPIAIYNNEKGIMTYNFDAEMLTIKINEQFVARNEQPSNRYIVESVQILDSLPSNSNVKPEIKIVILDTETSNTLCESPGTCTIGPVPWIGGLISGIVAVLIAIIGAL